MPYPVYMWPLITLYLPAPTCHTAQAWAAPCLQTPQYVLERDPQSTDNSTCIIRFVVGVEPLSGIHSSSLTRDHRTKTSRSGSSTRSGTTHANTGSAAPLSAASFTSSSISSAPDIDVERESLAYKAWCPARSQPCAWCSGMT
ncbi:hypothetical protein HaLaN_00204 [Haematococcus lacustris]|uniref:Secreted protein n=1 Tax=Haematococcus lacustris TaxID=44745 RepID=A0A699Y8U7_HAELA|nr:hypothetical protein HaLaN_00204 [Haematococcus lacustris]